MIKLKDITLSNIKSYIEGNYKAHYITLKNLPPLDQEQILYRFRVCKDTCLKVGECKKCFCEVPERMFIDKVIHECPYPKFLNDEDWQIFKTTNEYIKQNTEDSGI